MANYYVQKGTDEAKDIFTEYGIYVKQTIGLNNMPPIKKVFSRSWPEEQGDDVYLPSTAYYESKKVKITFYLSKTTISQVKNIYFFFFTICGFWRIHLLL